MKTCQPESKIYTEEKLYDIGEEISLLDEAPDFKELRPIIPTIGNDSVTQKQRHCILFTYLVCKFLLKTEYYTNFISYFYHLRIYYRTSLVVQWLRICLPM